MASETVELTIRCAMQNFEDRKVECPLEWSVLKLKQHLRDVYSGRPEVARQRLIHSGRCLENEQTLRSALRLDENNGGGSLVIHMVCAAVNNQPAGISSEGIRRRVVGNLNTAAATPQHSSNGPQQPAVYAQPTAYPYPMTAGVPLAAAPLPSTPLPLNGQNAYEAYAASYQNYVNQMFYHQQLFLQQQHYAGSPPTPLHFMPHGQAFYANLPVLQQHQAQFHPQNAFPMPQLQEVNPQEAINVAAANAGAAIDGAAGGGGEVAPPDILDLVYKAIRFSLLMMILYLYSSIERFFFVLAVIVVVWFIQARRRRNAAAARQWPTPQPAAAQGDGGNNSDEANQAQTNSPAPPPTISAWNVFWSTVVSFFSSLIPDAPMPVN